jgi:hypothetical protein
MSGAGSLVCSGFWVWARATPMPAIKTKLSRADRLRFVMVFSLIDCGHFTDCELLANGSLKIEQRGVYNILHFQFPIHHSQAGRGAAFSSLKMEDGY